MVHITQNTSGNGGALKWAVMESGCVWPREKVWYCAQIKSYRKLIFLKSQPKIWNTTCSEF